LLRGVVFFLPILVFVPIIVLIFVVIPIAFCVGILVYFRFNIVGIVHQLILLIVGAPVGSWGDVSNSLALGAANIPRSSSSRANPTILTS
jgi:hypothetical protein